LLSGLPSESFIQARWRTFVEIGGTSFGESWVRIPPARYCETANGRDGVSAMTIR
jgi:hypothetical protein